MFPLIRPEPPRREPFHLLQLPIIPQRQIIRQFDFIELIDLSLQSPFIFNFLHLYQIPIKSLTWQITNNFILRIILTFDNYPRQVQFHIGHNIQLIDESPVRKLKYERRKREIDCRRNSDKSTVHFWIDSPIEDMARIGLLADLTRHLFPITNIDSFILDAHLIERPRLFSRNFFIWHLIDHFHKIKIHSQDDYILTPEDVSFLLEDVTCDFIQLIDGPTNRPKFHYTPPLIHPELFLFNCEWLGIESILDSGSRSIVMSNKKMTSRDLNCILMTWQETRKLDTLEEFRADLYGPIDRQWIMNGILPVQGPERFMEEDEMEEEEAGDNRMAIYIRRKWNGRIAKLYLSSTNYIWFRVLN